MMNLRSVECYEEVTDSWSFTAPLTAHEGGVGVGVLPFQEDDPENCRQEQSDGSVVTSSPSDVSSDPASPADPAQAFFRRRSAAAVVEAAGNGAVADEAAEGDDEREELNEAESRRRRRALQERGTNGQERLSS